MPTVNQDFLDALIRHQIYLTRFAGSLRDQILKILGKTERDIEEAILRRLANNKGFDTQSAKRLRVLQGIITRVRTAAWDKVDETWLNGLIELAKYEPTFTRDALRAASPVTIDLLMPTAETLKALIKSTPMEGRVLRDWASRQRATDIQRIMTQVQIGMVQGEDARSIANRVVGTRQYHKLDGVTAVTRREAEALTRTAVNFVSNVARRELFTENIDLFDWERFVATLDARTTAICRAQDGKRYKVGKGPIPPLHFGCRSLRVAVISGDALGQRPARPFTERQLVREYAEKNDLGALSNRDDLPRGHKTAYDTFARGRIRDLTGTVPARTTYQQWLSTQSAEFQDDVLGATKGKLFRRGGLRLDKFVNQQGDELSLAELAQRERQAFIKAGLDPDEY